MTPGDPVAEGLVPPSTDLVLERVEYTDEATFGALVTPRGLRWVSLERPWRDNAPRVSCIPLGRYPLVQRRYYAGGYLTYEVTDVPDRSLILIHAANLASELAGCIAPGMERGAFRRRGPAVVTVEGVTRSREALSELLEAIRAEGLTHLRVVDAADVVRAA